MVANIFEWPIDDLNRDFDGVRLNESGSIGESYGERVTCCCQETQ